MATDSTVHRDTRFPPRGKQHRHKGTESKRRLKVKLTEDKMEGGKMHYKQSD